MENQRSKKTNENLKIFKIQKKTKSDEKIYFTIYDFEILKILSFEIFWDFFWFATIFKLK